MGQDQFDKVLQSLSVLRPKPSPIALVRVGGEGDGAYLIPADFNGVSSCFSPGVNNTKYFEDELADRYHIQSHMCDFTSDVSQFATPLKPGMQTFEKKWLDIDGSPDSLALGEWVANWEPNEADDLILQMDIEGAEYRTLLNADQGTLARFRIIVIELHGLKNALNPLRFEQKLGPLLRRLDESFVCVHIHPNNCCGEFVLPGTELNIPNLIEATFLRKDRFDDGNIHSWLPPTLPHPLDIKRNVNHEPPLFLNEHWSDYPTSLESRVKILVDTEDYYRNLSSKLKIEHQTLICLYRLLQADGPLPRVAGSSDRSDSVEIATGSSYRLSSAYGDYPLEGIVEPREPCFFHTGFGPMETITVDFGAEFVIDTIMVTNRTDTCYDRGRYLLYCLHDDPAPDFRFVRSLNPDATLTQSVDKTSKVRVPGIISRYLTVFTPEDTAIHLSAICVYGRGA
jgi:hypothetical protein